MNPGLLIIDKDQTSNEHLRGLLDSGYEVTVAPTLEQGRAQLADGDFVLVLGDFDIFRGAGHNVPQEIRNTRPQTRVAILSALDTEHYLRELLEWKCYHVLPKLPFYNARDVLLFIENIREPKKAFGLRRYLAPDAECSRSRITTRVDKNRTVEEIINFFASCEYEIHELYDVRLIMEEAINNAIFHAFVKEDGEAKYTSENFSSLEPSEEVWLEFGADATTIGFSVTDNGGRLTPERFIRTLARQYNKEGLYDESGRGLYLTRLLSGNLVFNIEKAKSTQVVVIFYEKRLNVPKPFCINYIAESRHVRLT